jgi:hypothetical protein
MHSSPSALLRLSVLFISALACANITSAQFSKLDGLASQLTKELKPFKPIVVAIVDFRSPDGSTLPQGHYSAWILSSYLEESAKNKFAVANHTDFDNDLAKLNILTGSRRISSIHRSPPWRRCPHNGHHRKTR